MWDIERVLHTCRSPDLSFEGVRYTVLIEGMEKYLYHRAGSGMFLLHRRTGTTNENLSYQRRNRGSRRKPDPAIYRETKAPAQLHRH